MKILCTLLNLLCAEPVSDAAWSFPQCEAGQGYSIDNVGSYHCVDLVARYAKPLIIDGKAVCAKLDKDGNLIDAGAACELVCPDGYEQVTRWKNNSPVGGCAKDFVEPR